MNKISIVFCSGYDGDMISKNSNLADFNLAKPIT